MIQRFFEDLHIRRLSEDFMKRSSGQIFFEFFIRSHSLKGLKKVLGPKKKCWGKARLAGPAAAIFGAQSKSGKNWPI